MENVLCSFASSCLFFFSRKSSPRTVSFFPNSRDFVREDGQVSHATALEERKRSPHNIVQNIMSFTRAVLTNRVGEREREREREKETESREQRERGLIFWGVKPADFNKQTGRSRAGLCALLYPTSCKNNKQKEVGCGALNFGTLRAKKENTIYKDNKWFVAFHGAESITASSSSIHDKRLHATVDRRRAGLLMGWQMM